MLTCERCGRGFDELGAQLFGTPPAPCWCDACRTQASAEQLACEWRANRATVIVLLTTAILVLLAAVWHGWKKDGRPGPAAPREPDRVPPDPHPDDDPPAAEAKEVRVITQGRSIAILLTYWPLAVLAADVPVAQTVEVRAGNSFRAADNAIDCGGGLVQYPWTNPPEAKQDGLAVKGDGTFIGERLKFKQVPGVALRLAAGLVSQLADIRVERAIHGLIVESGDAKLRGIIIESIARDGLTLAAPGVVVEGDHIWGADRAAVVLWPAEIHHAYHEAARIGTHLVGNASGTRIDGLNIGPGTCWHRGVKIEVHGCSITGLTGMVKGESDLHPDVAGVELASGVKHHLIAGDLVLDGNGCDGLILRGHRNKVDLKGGWNKKVEAAFLRVAEPVTGSTVEINGSGDGGTVLDLSASRLDRVEGLGNEFKIKWSGSATRVIYPGGGKFNLAPGTTVLIDGKLQP